MKRFLKILVSIALAGIMAFTTACIYDVEQAQTPGVELQAALGAPIHIDLSGQGITCERLAEMVHSGEIPAYVTHLNLAVNYIADITPLSDLPRLVELSLWGNIVSDLTALRGLTDITHLDLWGNEFADLSPIAGLINLVGLSVGDNINFNGDLSVLKNFTQLTNLGLGDTWQTQMDFSPI